MIKRYPGENQKYPNQEIIGMGKEIRKIGPLLLIDFPKEMKAQPEDAAGVEADLQIATLLRFLPLKINLEDVAHCPVLLDIDLDHDLKVFPDPEVPLLEDLREQEETTLIEPNDVLDLTAVKLQILVTPPPLT